MTSERHILVVDDDPAICDLIQTYLASEGFRVSTIGNGNVMRQALEEGAVDLVILDLMLPGQDGFALTRYLRERSDVGIIILTGKGAMVDRVVGLELGADDYLAKPFDLRELLARVRSVLRRARGQDSPPGTKTADAVRFAGWRLELATRRLVSSRGDEVPLTTGEYDLLVAFLDHPNRVLSRDKLLDITRGREAGPFDRSVDVQVGRLRQKIESDPQSPTLIKTVRAAGYIFTAAVARD